MTFYDYDTSFRGDSVVYKLRAHGRSLPNGAYCSVYEQGGVFVRKTNWLARFGHGGVRYERYTSLNDALLAGIYWARRRERADARNTNLNTKG